MKPLEGKSRLSRLSQVTESAQRAVTPLRNWLASGTRVEAAARLDVDVLVRVRRALRHHVFEEVVADV